MILVDTNVLLYAHDRSDPRHEAAAAWLEDVLSGEEDVGLATVAVLAFVRIATDPRVYAQPRSVADALEIVQGWFARDQVRLVDPTPLHWARLSEAVTSGQARGPLIMDAHLASLALEHGATLATTDRDFRRFDGLRLIDPTTG